MRNLFFADKIVPRVAWQHANGDALLCDNGYKAPLNSTQNVRHQYLQNSESELSDALL
jgi:hypothetical protein